MEVFAKIFDTDKTQVLFYKDFKETDNGTIYRIIAISQHGSGNAKLEYAYKSEKKRNAHFCDLTEEIAQEHARTVGRAFC